MAAKKPDKPTKREEQLGRMLVSIYETGYLDKNQTYKNSFIKGVLGGVGGVLGATIVIAFLLWILSLFSQVPLIGHFVNSVRYTIQQKEQ